MSDHPASQEDALIGVRPRLLRYFSCRGLAWAADELADDVILRVLEKLRAGQVILNIEAFVLGVARNVLLERLRRPEPDALPDDHEATASEPPDSTALDALDWCLRQHDPSSLVLRYYGEGREGKNKDIRKALAADLQTTGDALYLRASRLRRKVVTCLMSRLAVLGYSVDRKAGISSLMKGDHT